MAKRIFVFSSNMAGFHGKGAARYALEKKGAQMGKGFGHYGNSFAVPTKDHLLNPLSLNEIRVMVYAFILFARYHRKLTFQVTQLGCGLAGYTAKDIAPLFYGAPSNCLFDEAWAKYLPASANFWGTK